MKLLTLLKPNSAVGFSSSLLITILTVMLCVNYIDHQVVTYLNEHPFKESIGVSIILSIPVLMGLFSILYILAYVLTLYKKVGTSLYKDMFIITVTYMVTVSIKNFLKIAFGRTWPNQTPSFFPDDNIASGLKDRGQLITEGFHPFTGLREFASFPSGSTSIAVCFLIMLAVLFPKTRIPAFVIGLSVSVLLVLTNIHYVSDVIAGLFIGTSAALLSLKVTGRDTTS
ncbi:phosphatase PAP2 family protein [Idiomarina sp. Sol25]|uniref:phosphatase PAP2 family protein n=1 Tax=Idiomarina sp. Sol25 TaxID=3064000 RepID=UPI00294AC7D3|nr:phosphatase PAP2 family protein [Idiomarina sp. Sol25]MDV6328533.1 phosphatase PAP2 family protein [Idiomarina sp. Sol25]